MTLPVPPSWLEGVLPKADTRGYWCKAGRSVQRNNALSADRGGPAIRSLRRCPFSRMNKPQCHSLSLQSKCSNPWPFLWHFAELPPADHYLSCYWCSLSWAECLDVVSGGWVEGNNHSRVYWPWSCDYCLGCSCPRSHFEGSCSAHLPTSSPGEQRDCFRGLFLPGAGLYICPCWIL